MSSYHHSGDLDNPGSFDLTLLNGHGQPFTNALAIGTPFVERIGFGNNGVVGVWLATNTTEDHSINHLLRMVRRMIDKMLSNYGVPSEGILNPRPTWSSRCKTKTLLDINPFSKTKGNRKRQKIAKVYWHIRDESDRHDQSDGSGLHFFEWCKHNQGILPRVEDMPLENLFSENRTPYGYNFGRIRNDLLTVSSQG